MAEGNGKYFKKDRCRYFDVSIGSSFECAGSLDILSVRNVITDEEVRTGKQMLK